MTLNFQSQQRKVFLAKKTTRFMKTNDESNALILNYLRLLNHLSNKSKRALIKKLQLTLGKQPKRSMSSFYQAYGAWESNDTADDLISSIRESRVFKRQVEQL